MTKFRHFLVVSWIWIGVLALCVGLPPAHAALTIEDLDQSVSNRDTSFFRDFFDSIFYDPFAEWLRFDELWEHVSFKKQPALDVNVFDEVPDSGFFANRHGRNKMTATELKRGPGRDSGPDPNGPWRVLKGKTEGVSAGFFIEDVTGERYLLKFDPKQHLDLATSAEIISHKFFYAIGYHVPEYYLVRFKPDILHIDPKATYYDENGFKKQLTQDALQDLLNRIPKQKGGVIRASASKLLRNHKGYMDFEGRRKGDPADRVPHEDRRTIRALRVFGSWLNHYDLRKGNTLDVIEIQEGEPIVMHYLIDFGSTLGSAADHVKNPVAGFEHAIDWFEIDKASALLKIVEDPWEKRWDAAGRSFESSSMGYFDNVEFNPGKWKPQLPYDAFEELTKGDAFWAAKIIMAFSDEDIAGLVKTGEFAKSSDSETVTRVLTERRDIVGRYWFERVTPAGNIRLFHVAGDTYELSFEDLSVRYGFQDQASSMYRFQIEGGKVSESPSPSFSFEVTGDRHDLRIQVKRGASAKWSKPALSVVIARGEGGRFQIAEIDHGV